MIKKSKLAKWKLICEKATKGPWTLSEQQDGAITVDDLGHAHGHLLHYHRQLARLPELRANAELYAASRTAMPMLIDEVVYLRTVIDDLMQLGQKSRHIGDLERRLRGLVEEGYQEVKYPGYADSGEP